MTDKISYQGEPGAFSHAACGEVYPDLEPMACPTFEDAFEAVEKGAARLAMIPVENSVAGRVADIHHLLPDSSLSIIAEHFSPVRFNVLAKPGVKLDDIKTVASHHMALAQCRKLISARKWAAMREMDTAGAARLVAEGEIRAEAALASALAGNIHGLEALLSDVQDDPENTTRFIVLAREPVKPPADAPCMTSFLFRVRNVPAALYKAMGGFATNGVNMTKLESYQIGGRFAATQFYADIEGRPEDLPVSRALEELGFFTTHVRIVGTYPQHIYRRSRAGLP
ncbi:MAG: prephenate dehydratase [Maricaulaceae bacterium]